MFAGKSVFRRASPIDNHEQHVSKLHRRSIRSITGLLIGAALVLVSACSSSSSQSSVNATNSPSSAKSLTIYSGQHEQTVQQLVAGFTASTGIKVNLRSGNEAELATQILTEGKDSPADVFYAGNPPALQALSAKGLLKVLPDEILSKTPAQYSAADKQWVGVSARVGALVYNTKLISQAQLPTSLLELATAKWKGRFGFAPTETDFAPFITAIAKLKGQAVAQEFLNGLKANAKTYEDNEAIVAAVNRGEVATGLIEHYYWYRLQKELGDSGIKSALHYFAPGDVGNLLAVSGAGQLAASRNSEQARQFLSYLVSPEGQKIIANSDSFEYPLASGVSTAKPLKPFAQLRPPAVASADLGDGVAALEMLRKTGLL